MSTDLASEGRTITCLPTHTLSLILAFAGGGGAGAYRSCRALAAAGRSLFHHPHCAAVYALSRWGPRDAVRNVPTLLRCTAGVRTPPGIRRMTSAAAAAAAATGQQQSRSSLPLLALLLELRALGADQEPQLREVLLEAVTTDDADLAAAVWGMGVDIHDSLAEDPDTPLTAFDAAVAAGRMRMARLALSRGYNPARDDDASVAARCAATEAVSSGRWPGAVRFVVREGRVDALRHGWRALATALLHRAAPEAVKELLAHGAVECGGLPQQGRELLLRACERGSLEVCQALLSQGVGLGVGQLTREQKLAFVSVATQRRHRQLAAWLKQFWRV